MEDSVILHSFAKTLGARKVSNQDLTQLMETTEEWIVQRTGIKTRYWVEPGTGSSDLGADAARQTLALAKDISVDAIVAGTLSPDYYFPGIGVLIQSKLGLPHIPAYDIRLQCSGFLYGLEMASALIKSQHYKNILLVAAEVHSTGLDISTRGRDLAVLFGDGAGACMVSSRDAAPSQGIKFDFIGSELHSDGSHAQDLWCKVPGSLHFTQSLTQAEFDDGIVFPKMNGRKVFENAVRRMTEVSLSLLKRVGLSAQDIHLFIPHQANMRINQMVGEQLGLQPEQIFNTIDRYGNTTAATIPIGLTDAIAEGRVSSGKIILHAAFGSGFTWGAAVLKARN